MSDTFGFVYSSVAGVGMGVFTVSDSNLIGSDLAGGRYRGTVSVDAATGEIDLSFEMTVPAGVFLVQGTSPQDLPYVKSETVRVPPEFNDGKPFEIFFPPASVTLMVKRIPDEFARYSYGVILTAHPAKWP